MKINKILMVSIMLLAILTIGAVSANDTLTAADNTADDISAVSDIDPITDDGDGDDEFDDETDPDDYEDDPDDYEDETTGNESFDFKIITPDEIVAMDSTEINITSLPDDLAGYFTFYFDDEYDDEIWANSYENIRFYHTFEELGDHTITVKYSGDEKYSPVEKTKEIEISKYTVRPYNDEVSYGSKWITLELPYGFEGTVIVDFKGKTYRIERDEDTDEYSLRTDDLDFGVNTFHAYYEGDEEFAEMNTTFTITCNPAIQITEDDYVRYNDNTSVYLYLPKNETGTLTVYLMSEDEETWETIYTPIGSADIENGYASVPISKLALGYQELFAQFNGSCEVNPDYFHITIEPNIEIPAYIFANTTLEIRYGVPSTENVNITIYKRIYDDDTEAYEDVLIKHVETTGSTSVSIDDLKDEKNRIIIKDSNDNEVYEQNVYVINNTNIELKFRTPIDKKIIPGNDQCFSLDMPEYATGSISVYVDGKKIDKEDEDIYYFYYTFPTENLALGNHTLEVRFESDTFKNATLTDTFEVTEIIIRIPEKVIVNDYEAPEANYARVALVDGVTGYVEFIVDGNLFENVTVDEYAYASANLRTLPIGNHTISVIYSGDDRHPKTVKTANIVVDYRMYVSTENITYGDDREFYISLPEDISTGDIIATINGKAHEVIYSEGMYRINATGLEIGDYTLVVTYTGDSKYPAKSVNETFSVVAGISESYRNVYWGDEGDQISVTLPENAKGSLALNITDKSTGITEHVEIPLENGKASYNVTQLGLGTYLIEYGYTGSDYNIKDDHYTLNVEANIEFDYDTKMTVFESQSINVTSQDIEGSLLNVLIVLHTGEYEYDEYGDYNEIIKTVEDTNITLTKGRASYTIENLALGDYEITASYIVNGKVIRTDSKNLQVTANITMDTKVDTTKDNNITVALPGDATGEVTLTIYDNDGDEVDTITESVDNGAAVITLPKLDAGEYDYYITYNGNYGKTTTRVYDVEVGMDVTFPDEFNLTGPTEIKYNIGDAKGTISLYADGELIKTLDDATGKGSIEIPSEYTTENYYFKFVFEGDDGTGFEKEDSIYPLYRTNPNMEVNTNTPSEGSDLIINVTLAKRATGTVFATINGKTYNTTANNGIATITVNGLKADDYVTTVRYEGDSIFADATQNITATVALAERAAPTITITSADKIAEGTNLDVEVKVAGATGNVIINGKQIALENSVAKTTIYMLPVGENTITVTYSGDKKYLNATKTKTVTVTGKDNLVAPEITVDSIAGKTPTLKITLPSDATGNVLVSAGGMNQTQTLEKGTATFTLSGLKVGTYEATVTYAGDGKYLSATAKANATVLTDAKIVASNKAVYYNAGSKYSVTVYGTDGKVAQGTYVTFKVAGKTVAKVKTNTKGVASFKVKQIPKTYKVSATALAKTVTKKLTVKHVVTLKTAVVKKSAKQLVLQATLKQGKTALKNKIVKFKFNGKTYKVKTNKKGVAKLIIKKTVLSKLKVGKKLTYQATYLKDTVKKTVKVKK
ncbi:Ig-like domain repeat protein [Methanobrevibacter sp.]|uniref:Ig-like domain repeat protein n=1 Tax=Methanobrevibacter sp. TaxID=66852 RepID=UPI0026E0EAC4|nr:Ig-like domain repeat protein [Methanobrevibacter sp.]MDO5860154.1 Ig-like domain repeat protein [Methanobrevibacter sp.]